MNKCRKRYPGNGKFIEIAICRKCRKINLILTCPRCLFQTKIHCVFMNRYTQQINVGNHWFSVEIILFLVQIKVSFVAIF